MKTTYIVVMLTGFTDGRWIEEHEFDTLEKALQIAEEFKNTIGIDIKTPSGARFAFEY